MRRAAPPQSPAALSATSRPPGPPPAGAPVAGSEAGMISVGVAVGGSTVSVAVGGSAVGGSAVGGSAVGQAVAVGVGSSSRAGVEEGPGCRRLRSLRSSLPPSSPPPLSAGGCAGGSGDGSAVATGGGGDVGLGTSVAGGGGSGSGVSVRARGGMARTRADAARADGMDQAAQTGRTMASARPATKLSRCIGVHGPTAGQPSVNAEASGSGPADSCDRRRSFGRRA